MKKTYEIVVCANAETVCDGYDIEPWGEEATAEAFRAASRLVDDADLGAVAVPASHFADWHGGRHYKCGGRVGAVPAWGYRAGLVCCHAREVPPQIADLIDRAYEAMQAVLLAEESRVATERATLAAEEH